MKKILKIIISFLPFVWINGDILLHLGETRPAYILDGSLLFVGIFVLGFFGLGVYHFLTLCDQFIGWIAGRWLQ